MTPPETPRPDLDSLVAHYRDLLGLRDWTITAEWRDDLGDALACVIPTPTRRLATLYVATSCPAEELRASVVHELVHALLSPLTAVAEPSGAAVMLEEQAVEALALAVVRAEQSPTDRGAMARALSRLAPQVRARVSAAAGRRRSRMDPKMLAALALEGGALMANEGLPEEVAAWIKKAVEAMSGGALEAAPESTPDPNAPAARKPEDEEDDDEDKDMSEDERKLRRRLVRKFGRAALGMLGERDPIRARGILGARLEQAAELLATKARLEQTTKISDAARREKLWEDGVSDRRVQLAQAFRVVDGADGKPKRVYTAWAEKQNAAYPEIEAFEAWITSRVPEPGALKREETPSTALVDQAAQRRASHQLTERDRQEAKRAGINPDQLAAQLAEQNRGAERADERI